MSTIKANDIQNASGGIPTVKGQKLIPTAWVNFNGSGVVAIRDSEGVSSIVDTAVGHYTVNFATTMSNINYAVLGSTERASNWADGGINITAPFTTTYIKVENVEAIAGTDTNIFCVLVLGGQ